MRIGGGGGEARIMTGSHRYQVASVSSLNLLLSFPVTSNPRKTCLKNLPCVFDAGTAHGAVRSVAPRLVPTTASGSLLNPLRT
jgi:hypothetical protein